MTSSNRASGGPAIGARGLFWGILGTALALGAGLLWRPSGGPGHPQTPSVDEAMATQADVATLQREIDKLKRESRAARIKAGEARPMAEAPPTASALNAAPPPLDKEAARAEREARVVAAKERMEVEINSQARDRGFEWELAEELRAVYELPELAGTQASSVDCFATLCRVSSQHDSLEAMRTFATNASKFPPFQTEIFYSYGKGENPVSTLYLARKGARLPRDF